MLRAIIAVVFVGCCFAPFAAAGPTRIWEDYKGRRIEAEFVRIAPDGRVVLMRGKTVYLLQFEELSDGDCEWIRERVTGKKKELIPPLNVIQSRREALTQAMQKAQPGAGGAREGGGGGGEAMPPPAIHNPEIPEPANPNQAPDKPAVPPPVVNIPETPMPGRALEAEREDEPTKVEFRLLPRGSEPVVRHRTDPSDAAVWEADDADAPGETSGAGIFVGGVLGLLALGGGIVVVMAASQR